MTQPKPYRCVQFVPTEVLFRASRAIDFGNVGHWSEQFEEHYNIKLGDLHPTDDRCTVIFPSDEDYTMFMLKWS